MSLHKDSILEFVQKSINIIVYFSCETTMEIANVATLVDA